MANIANITVFDGAATPVSHTLVPVQIYREGKKVIADWKENLPGVPDYAQLTIRIVSEKLPTGVTKVITKVEVPVMEAINGANAAGYTAAPKVAYVDRAEGIHYVSPRSVIAGRRNARQILTNLCGNVSTSVVPATSGFVIDAVDNLIMPT